MANSRVTRGRQTEREVAHYMREHGFVGAEAVGASEIGTDIDGIPGWDIEVKASRDNPIQSAIRQQHKRTKGDIPGFVVWRPDGYGPEKIDDWVVAMPLSEWIRHMQELEFPSTVAMAPLDDFNVNFPGEVRDAINTLQEWVERHE